MTTYPAGVRLRPLAAWPGELTTRRQNSKFKTTAAVSMREIREEVRKLGGAADSIELHIAATEAQFTNDGKRLRAGESPWHPGVILVFDSRKGQMRFPCDTYPHWADNLRAIAVTLKLLRDLDRHGVTTGQQFNAFLALESGTAMPAKSSALNDWASAGQAIDFLIRHAKSEDRSDLAKIQRLALRHTHPDLGGDRDVHQRVQSAIDYLRLNGRTSL